MNGWCTTWKLIKNIGVKTLISFEIELSSVLAKIILYWVKEFIESSFFFRMSLLQSKDGVFFLGFVCISSFKRCFSNQWHLNDETFSWLPDVGWNLVHLNFTSTVFLQYSCQLHKKSSRVSLLSDTLIVIYLKNNWKIIKFIILVNTNQSNFDPGLSP